MAEQMIPPPGVPGRVEIFINKANQLGLIVHGAIKDTPVALMVHFDIAQTENFIGQLIRLHQMMIGQGAAPQPPNSKLNGS